MDVAFYVAAGVACVSAVMVITRSQAVHALLYLLVTLLALAVAFYVLGAHLAAALEVIVYAGATLVLFVFVVMMLNVRTAERRFRRRLLRPRVWVGPALLAGVLLAELVVVLPPGAAQAVAGRVVPAKEVAQALFGPYLVGVELASLMLLAGLVAAYHLARPGPPDEPRREEDD